jgi:hypothetical protein
MCGPNVGTATSSPAGRRRGALLGGRSDDRFDPNSASPLKASQCPEFDGRRDHALGIALSQRRQFDDPTGNHKGR